ncbi:hypothetical protein M3J09_005328 [Ascochyta lentis]
MFTMSDRGLECRCRLHISSTSQSAVIMKLTRLFHLSKIRRVYRPWNYRTSESTFSLHFRH